MGEEPHSAQKIFCMGDRTAQSGRRTPALLHLHFLSSHRFIFGVYVFPQFLIYSGTKSGCPMMVSIYHEYYKFQIHWGSAAYIQLELCRNPSFGGSQHTLPYQQVVVDPSWPSGMTHTKVEKKQDMLGGEVC